MLLEGIAADLEAGYLHATFDAPDKVSDRLREAALLVLRLSTSIREREKHE